MTLSNWHSFHNAGTLQNATALPASAYQEISNRPTVNQPRHQYSKQYWLAKQRQASAKKYKPSPDMAQSKAPAQVDKPVYSEDFVAPPFPEKRKPVTIDGNARKKKKYKSPAKPTIAESTHKPRQSIKPTPRDTSHTARTRHTAAVKPKSTPKKHTNRAKPVTHKAKRVTWKPGRGAVEKIDKLSGEIFHLVEAG